MRKNIIRSIFVAVALTGAAFLVFGSGKSETTSSSCPESMEQCCQKKGRNGGTDNMIRETLSGQFFTYTGFN